MFLVMFIAPAWGLTGCGAALRPFSQEHVEMQAYKPLTVAASTSVRDRWQKLQLLASQEEWHLQTFDETRGLMIAARGTKDSTEVREHVRVVLRPETSEIAVQTEVLQDGEWDTRDLTCGKYEYSRETEIAMRIEK
ncbi:MAG: hypothetical protein ABIS92_01095 [Polyangia bacterium]